MDTAQKVHTAEEPPKPINFDPTPFLSDEALDSLNYLDGQTTVEVAEQFKLQGNEAFNKGKEYFKAAQNYYSKAIRQPNVPANKRTVYFSNRAAVEFELENYGKSIEDCNEAIKLDPKNLKAYYRGHKASNKLGKFEEGLDFLTEGLKVDPENTALLQAKKKFEEKLLEKQRDDMDKKVDVFMNSRHKKAIWNVLGMRGVTLGEDLFENLTHVTRANKIWLDRADLLHWPVLFMYEEYKQLDLIADFQENTTFNTHLEVVFPGGDHWAEWDVHHQYDYQRIEIYTVLSHVQPLQKSKRTGKMPNRILVDKNSTLKEILKNPDYIVPGNPVFWIVTPEYREAFFKLTFETLNTGY